jgi:predicted acyl esterase
LKAVISIASSVDRYNDDIHYRNGCHLGAHLAWATTMLGYIARPPDSDIVGDRWREMWHQRLEAIEPASFTWMAHQRRDDFWKRGSVGDDFDAIQIPALMIAGWADGYRNTPMKAVAGLGIQQGCAARELTPHFAFLGRAVDFHSEAIRWWDRWLQDAERCADRRLQRAFHSCAVRPG